MRLEQVGGADYAAIGARVKVLTRSCGSLVGRRCATQEALTVVQVMGDAGLYGDVNRGDEKRWTGCRMVCIC